MNFLSWMVGVALLATSSEASAQESPPVAPWGFFASAPSTIIVHGETPEILRARTERVARLEKRHNLRLGLVLGGIPIAALGVAGTSALGYGMTQCHGSDQCQIGIAYLLFPTLFTATVAAGGISMIVIGATRSADPDVGRSTRPVVAVGPGSVRLAVGF